MTIGQVCCERIHDLCDEKKNFSEQTQYHDAE